MPTQIYDQFILSSDEYEKVKEEHHRTNNYPLKRALHDYASELKYFLGKTDMELEDLNELKFFSNGLKALRRPGITQEEINNMNY